MQKKLFNLKKVLLMVIMACFVCSWSITVHAETVDEIDSENGTMATAQLIQANAENALGAANGTYDGQYVVEGKASISDTDWYKVYLEAGKQYMTCNGYDFDFEIMDASGQRVYEYSYSMDAYGPTAYSFNTSSSGYYYVKITGILSTAKDYLFLVGSPTYSVASCEIPCKEGSITMTSSGGTQTGTFNGKALTEIPEGAIAYKVGMSGVRTTSVSSIVLKNKEAGLSLSLARYTWDKNKLGSMYLPVLSEWTASFGYFKATTFTPVLKVYFAYPVVSTILR